MSDHKCGHHKGPHHGPHHHNHAEKCSPDKVNLPLIGDKAPEFEAETTKGVINFPADYEGKWVVLFSHPGDFTPVCTTEFITFAQMADEFAELNTELIGLSIDSTPSHHAWVKSIEGIDWKDYKGTKVNFPIINDLSMDVSGKYGMVHSKGGTATIRAVFIIDDKGIVRLIMYYPASVGRNMDEIKRVVQALQKADSASAATPADWRPGEPLIDPIPASQDGVRERLENAEANNLDVKDWYLVFKEDPEK